jgi:PadR family transcriptional regulator PadR
MRTSTLDICLLAVIEQKDSYGYDLVETLKAEGLPVGNERTVYPLLGKLELDGLLESYLKASHEGPARKYYRISEAGREALRMRARRTFGIHDASRHIVTSRIDLGELS